MRTWPLLFTVVATTVLLAGCTFPQGTPEERIAAALEAFPEDLGPDGDLAKLEGTGSMDAEEFATDFTFEMTYGSNDVTRIEAAAQGMVLTVWCGPETVVISMMMGTFESRNGDDGCEFADDGQEFEVPLENLPEYEIVSVQENDDGTLDATIRVFPDEDERDGDETDEEVEEMLIDITIDERNRIVAMTFSVEEGTFDLNAVYGDREPITMPKDADRLPANIELDVTTNDDGYVGTVFGAPDGLPLAEFEAWVYDDDPSQPLATFPLAADTERSEGGFTFRFTDNGDGLLSEGDRFTVVAEEGAGFYQVTIYDAWADATIDEAGIPAPSLALVLAGLVGSLTLARPRRA